MEVALIPPLQGNILKVVHKRALKGLIYVFYTNYFDKLNNLATDNLSNSNIYCSKLGFKVNEKCLYIGLHDNIQKKCTFANKATVYSTQLIQK